jgi:hypothetical protein
MAAHTEYALRCPRILQILDLSLAVPAAKTSCAKCLVPGEDRQIFNLVATGRTTVGTTVANKRSIAEEKQVRVRVKERATRIASKAVDVPAISRCVPSVLLRFLHHGLRRARQVEAPAPRETRLTKLKCLSFLKDLHRCHCQHQDINVGTLYRGAHFHILCKE